ncbi:MAG: hypothetical protein KDC92_11270 [Bacteroidetes bacterium]|nr:hypothetical protein [Bacteroidota bacterium]
MNINIYRFIYTLLLVIPTLHACTEKFDDYELVPIRTDLTLSRITFNNDAYILVETVKEFDSYGYEITNNYEFKDGILSVYFDKIKKFNNPPPTIAPATALIEIDSTITFDLKMKLKRKWYTGKVEKGEISLDNPGKIKLKE